MIKVKLLLITILIHFSFYKNTYASDCTSKLRKLFNIMITTEVEKSLNKLRVKGLVIKETEAFVYNQLMERVEFYLTGGKYRIKGASRRAYLDVQDFLVKHSVKAYGKLSVGLGKVEGGGEIPKVVNYTSGTKFHVIDHISSESGYIINTEDVLSAYSLGFVKRANGSNEKLNELLTHVEISQDDTFKDPSTSFVEKMIKLETELRDKSYEPFRRLGIQGFFDYLVEKGRVGKSTTIWHIGLEELLEILPYSSSKRLVGVTEEGHGNVSIVADLPYGKLEYVMKVCVKEKCHVGGGKYYKKGQVISVFPLCGPDVFILPSKENALKMLEQFINTGRLNAKLRKRLPQQVKCK